MLTLLVFVGLPFLIFFLALLFSGGWGTFIAFGAIIALIFLVPVLTQ
jgi:hypothetical protein